MKMWVPSAGGGRWVANRPAPGDSRPRLFCFPHAGGGASHFAAWGASLASAVVTCPVELPGRGRRFSEPTFRHMDPLVDATATALRPWFDRPFAFLGHSLGALIAFEVARHLALAGGPRPSLLLLSGCHPPHRIPTGRMTYSLPDDEFKCELRRLNGTTSEVIASRELMDLMLPILRADFEVFETYHVRANDPLDCPLRVLGGESDPEVTRDELREWRDYSTASDFDLRMFPGDHFFMYTALPVVLAFVLSCLNERFTGVEFDA